MGDTLHAESAPPGNVPLPSATQRVLRRVAAAFVYRDFRTLWLGSFTSSVGTWMQNVAQNWLILSLTGSAFFLGLDAFLQQLPVMLFTLIGGVLADRRDRRLTLMASQYIQMGSALTLALLVFLGVIRIWEVLTLSFVTGLAQSFGGPANQALLPSLVEKRDLPNAVALNSIQFNLARVIGPLLAGVALAAFGMVSCFTLNGLSFLVVIVALMSLHVRHIPPTTPQRMVDGLRDGFHYVRHRSGIIALIVIAAATTFLGYPLMTFLPIFAQKVFHEDVGGYSVMMAFSGAGAVCGALLVAWMGQYRRMGRTVLVMEMVFGGLIVAFAASRSIWLSYGILFCTGAGMLIIFSTVNSLVQLIVPNEVRGRVMSIYMVAFRGGMPLGSLAAGYFASLTSAPLVLGINGVLLACVSAYFLTRDHGIKAL
ncbi:MAG TPA: MFS transporter [Vicinamibacterales bacterium]|nr:MFS transporter [Vicinamibacterales bacterium]